MTEEQLTLNILKDNSYCPEQIVTPLVSSSFNGTDLPDDLPENADGRLNLTNYLFVRELVDLDTVAYSYQTWLSKKCVLCYYNGQVYLFGFASKRGNKLYANRVETRFRSLEIHNPKQFFNPRSRELKNTNMLFVTLTVRNNVPLYSAWRDIGKNWNRFLSSLKKEFGCNVYSIRSFESTSKGYPHIHALLYFDGYAHQVSHQVSKIINHEYRKIFYVKTSDRVKKHWDAITDIQACYNTDVTYYLGKHNSKFNRELIGQEDKKHLYTLALCWAMRKRSFAISRKLKDILNLDTHGCITQTKIIKFHVRWELVGIVYLGDNEDLTESGLSELFRRFVHQDDLTPTDKDLVGRAREWTENKRLRDSAICFRKRGS